MGCRLASWVLSFIVVVAVTAHAGACGGSGVQERAAPPPSAGDRQGEGEGEGEGACMVDEDCVDGSVCAQDCTDDCDQSRWPNECCTRTCRPVNTPWACEAAGGVVSSSSSCPAGHVVPARPDDWVPANQVSVCCLPERACAALAVRSLCEAYAGCRWALSGEVGPTPNDGECLVDDAVGVEQ